MACTEDSLREGNELPKVSVLVTIWRGGAQAFLPVLVDMARVAVFLGLPDSAYVTGQLIAVDGGYPAQGL